MKPIITKFNDKTGDVEITIPVPFTLKDGIEYANMMIADIPKYEDTKDYNVFDLIRENQKLKEQLEVGKEQYNDLVEEKEELQEQLSNSHQIKNQQKEFIEWLEKEIQGQEDYAVSLGLTIDYGIAEYTSGKIDALKEILSKYKEIVGGSNANVSRR